MIMLITDSVVMLLMGPLLVTFKWGPYDVCAWNAGGDGLGRSSKLRVGSKGAEMRPRSLTFERTPTKFVIAGPIGWG
jgi:hypothetical protein